jgi:hypothetical protein
MVEAEPAIVARTVKTGAAFTGRAEFARLPATGCHATALGIPDPAMKTIVLHRFHMAIVRVEGKP